jgi:hypothetical protein
LFKVAAMPLGDRAQDLPQVEARRDSGRKIEEQLKPLVLTLKFCFCAHGHARNRQFIAESVLIRKLGRSPVSSAHTSPAPTSPSKIGKKASVR